MTKTPKEYWGYSFGNESKRQAKGIPGRNITTATIFFIGKKDILDDR
jgi:hypothetical protein